MQTLAIDYPIISAWLSLALATLFSTLRASYHLAGEVGIQRLQERFENAAERLGYWEPRWPRLVITLNLFSIFFRLGFVTLMLYGMLPRLEQNAWVGFIFIGLATLVVWCFCYLVPNAVAEAFADRISVQTLPVIGGISRMLLPFTSSLSWIQRKLLSRVMEGSDEESRPSPEDEIRSVVEQADALELDKGERAMIRGIFELGDTVAREIMTPRIDVIGIEDALTVFESAMKIRETAHSRFPVHRDSIDEIAGMVHIKDLLNALTREKGEASIRTVVKPVAFVPESMPVADLLTHMQRQQHQISVVVDEYGGTAGLITMEDIIEEIVGEIHDEYDQEKMTIQPISDRAFIVDARFNLEDLNERLLTDIPESDEYDSLAGFILHELGHIPPPGEQIVLEDCTLTVRSANAQQILTVQADLLEPIPAAV